MIKSQLTKEKMRFRLHPSRSLGMRIFLVFFISTMVLVLSLGYISYSVAKQTIQNNALSANRQTVIQTAEKLDIQLLRYEDRLEQVFYNNIIQDALRAESGSTTSTEVRKELSNKIVTELNEWLSVSEGIQAVHLVPMNEAIPVTSTGTMDSAFFESFRESSWFKQLQEKPQGLWISHDLQEGRTSEVIHFAKSVAGNSGSSAYIAICEIKISELENQLRKVDLGADSYIQLLTEKDALIASSLEQQTDTYLRLGGTLLHGVELESGALPTADEDGQSILAVYGTLESSGWRLLGVVPSENLTQDATRILKTTYIVVAVAAVVAILIGLWMMRMVSRPLNQLKDLMCKGAEGDLSVRTDYSSGDEIGQLSNSFNIMMGRITELVIHTNETAIRVLETADELSGASRKTAIAAKDIAAATEEFAEGASSLALEAERGNEMTGRISEQMDRVNSATHEMDDAVQSVGQLSTEGVLHLKELLSRTNSTSDMANKLVMKVNDLQESASSVIKVLEVMQNITDQTNILSLNATIEAARAGEAGQGFMVVANEIRKLANQSKQSIAVVSEITDKIRMDMNETVIALSEAAPLFSKQNISVHSTSEIFMSVKEQMDHFISRLNSVSLSMDSLTESQLVLSETISNVSSFSEESSAASEEVASLSSEQQSVSDHLVGLALKLENESLLLKEKLSKFSM